MPESSERSHGPLPRCAGYAQIPIVGVTFLAMLMMVALASILMGKAAETWDSQVRHEREEELIRRGEEYKFAIQQYWNVKRRPPTKLEELCPEDSRTERRFIRRCWDDPITGEPFRLILPGQQGQRARENRDRSQAESEAKALADPLLGGFGFRATPTPPPPRGSGPSLSNAAGGMPGRASDIEWSGDQPFVGVASNSDETAFKLYEDSEIYSEWEFVADVRTNTGRGRTGGRGGRSAPRNAPGGTIGNPAPAAQNP